MAKGKKPTGTVQPSPSPSSAPLAVQALVDRFSDQLEVYRSGRYNEAQLRQEFLNPFFKALGWDMDNERGYGEAYKDVIHEDAIRMEGTVKAPDYCFRIGGTRKFFLEAKKPSVDIKNEPTAAYQLRRYAWSAKLPLSILSDFEEFAVYDCRVKPEKNDSAATARIFVCTFRDYPEKWDYLTSIFSKDAIQKGSFDKFAESSKGKRGTSEVDAAFLAEIEAWRNDLARNLALRNPALTQRELNFAVQRIIDRIIFLRICEDRGIEDYGHLMGLTNGAGVYPRLCGVFEAADARYNSGLFHFRKEKGRHEDPDELTLKLDIDDKLLRGILTRLYYPDSPYEFSVLSADILGQVYEQFLGKVIRLTAGHRAVVEDKPEVKKAGGVYYTPTYIVDYIVRQTVGKQIEGKTPKQVEQLRVMDPACGSGSFLIGAYQFLLDWHRDWYVQNELGRHAKGSTPALRQTGRGGWVLTIDARKRILLNNIFGVDIDAQAVEVTKLSLLLKVLEGENEQSLQTVFQLLRVRALPDLGDNIKCGNTLVGPDFYDQERMDLLDEDERYRINVFDWRAEFPHIFNAGGFNTVIGNPPYGAYLYDIEKPYLRNTYPNQTYQLDSYLLFLERALRNLLRRDGLYGMIIPNPWLTNLLQTSIRKYVLETSRISTIVHFRFPVFRGVIVDTQVVILEQSNPDGQEAEVIVADTLHAFTANPWGDGIHRITHVQQKWRDLNGSVVNIFTTAVEERLAAKCLLAADRLDSLCAINVGIKPYQTGKGTPPQTARTVEERPFDSDRQVDSSYRPCLRGGDLGRFCIFPQAQRYLKFGAWLAEPRPAANFDAPVKILLRQTGDSLIAALDTKQRLCMNSVHVLVPRGKTPSPLFLLAVINSRLLNWFYHTLNPEVGEALAEVKKTNVAKLPVSRIEFANRDSKKLHDRLVALTEQMMALRAKDDHARTPQEQQAFSRQVAAADAQIDRLVYELYALTEEEIRIVEESTK